MSEWMLIGGLCVLTLLAVLMMAYPLRRHWRLLCVLMPGFILLAGILYYLWGGWFDWTKYLQLSVKKQQVQQMLQSVHGVDELIEKLQGKLKKNPRSARGWYLLGRLYAHEGQWQKAQQAFEKAHQLNPNEAQVTINLVQSLLQLNHQAFNEDIRNLLHQMLHIDPNQPDALAMLAMDAYTSQDYETAIEYWRRVLSMVPVQSEEAAYLRKAIDKAQQAMSLKK